MRSAECSWSCFCVLFHRRGGFGRLCAMGRGLPRAFRWHVGRSNLGFSRPAAFPGARQFRHQTFTLYNVWRRGRLRVRTSSLFAIAWDRQLVRQVGGNSTKIATRPPRSARRPRDHHRSDRRGSGLFIETDVARHLSTPCETRDAEATASEPAISTTHASTRETARLMTVSQGEI